MYNSTNKIKKLQLALVKKTKHKEKAPKRTCKSYSKICTIIHYFNTKYCSEADSCSRNFHKTLVLKAI